jgi:quercetin dioxygenase-like cupin family protein
MMEVKPIVYGTVNGSIYDFPEVGDTLPMHTHDELTVHISIVARGSFRAFGNGWHCTLNSGDIVDWPAHQEHEFVALEPNSRLVNIVKGIP